MVAASQNYLPVQNGTTTSFNVQCQTRTWCIKNLMKAVEDLREHRSSNKKAKEIRNIEEKHKTSPLFQSTSKRQKNSKQELIDSHVCRFDK
ncbi:hypothetical protein ACF0H5_019472 [Mactra antiquata]